MESAGLFPKLRSTLCHRYLRFHRCDREGCSFEHRAPRPGELLPDCPHEVAKVACKFPDTCPCVHRDSQQTMSRETIAHKRPITVYGEREMTNKELMKALANALGEPKLPSTQAYGCGSTLCAEESTHFLSIAEWSAHKHRVHRQLWNCSQCHEAFKDLDGLRGHWALKQTHKNRKGWIVVCRNSNFLPHFPVLVKRIQNTKDAQKTHAAGELEATPRPGDKTATQTQAGSAKETQRRALTISVGTDIGTAEFNNLENYPIVATLASDEAYACAENECREKFDNIVLWSSHESKDHLMVWKCFCGKFCTRFEGIIEHWEEMREKTDPQKHGLMDEWGKMPIILNLTTKTQGNNAELLIDFEEETLSFTPEADILPQPTEPKTASEKPKELEAVTAAALQQNFLDEKSNKANNSGKEDNYGEDSLNVKTAVKNGHAKGQKKRAKKAMMTVSVKSEDGSSPSNSSDLDHFLKGATANELPEPKVDSLRHLPRMAKPIPIEKWQKDVTTSPSKTLPSAGPLYSASAQFFAHDYAFTREFNIAHEQDPLGVPDNDTTIGLAEQERIKKLQELQEQDGNEVGGIQGKDVVVGASGHGTLNVPPAGTGHAETTHAGAITAGTINSGFQQTTINAGNTAVLIDLSQEPVSDSLVPGVSTPKASNDPASDAELPDALKNSRSHIHTLSGKATITSCGPAPAAQVEALKDPDTDYCYTDIGAPKKGSDRLLSDSVADQDAELDREKALRAMFPRREARTMKNHSSEH